MDIKKSKIYEIIDLTEWEENLSLNINPKYQRNPVWQESTKSFLIDTIMRGYPIPPLFFRESFDFNLKKNNKEVIDGQQRIRAILGFYHNEFPIMKKHNKEFGGQYFKDLSEAEQEAFLKYSLFVDSIIEKDDSIIYDIFARLNSNAANVNKQEIRNAKYWGEFKTSVYKVSSLIRDFFIDYQIFTNNQLSRMVDMEFVSNLFILAIEGIADESAAKIDKYYKLYDNKFEKSTEIEDIIIKTMKFLDSVFSGFDKNTTKFNNKTYLYDLIAVCLLKDHKIKLDDIDVARKMPSVDILRYKLAELNYNLTKKDIADLKLIKFEQCHRNHSTAKNEREERVRFLFNYITNT